MVPKVFKPLKFNSMYNYLSPLQYPRQLREQRYQNLHSWADLTHDVDYRTVVVSGEIRNTLYTNNLHSPGSSVWLVRLHLHTGRAHRGRYLEGSSFLNISQNPQVSCQAWEQEL